MNYKMKKKIKTNEKILDLLKQVKSELIADNRNYKIKTQILKEQNHELIGRTLALRDEVYYLRKSINDILRIKNINNVDAMRLLIASRAPNG